MTNREQELRDLVLEIEWRSRRRPTRTTLAEINAIARTALGTALVSEPAPAPAPARRSHEAVLAR
jgi:hypothetical protein